MIDFNYFFKELKEDFPNANIDDIRGLIKYVYSCGYSEGEKHGKMSLVANQREFVQNPIEAYSDLRTIDMEKTSFKERSPLPNIPEEYYEIVNGEKTVNWNKYNESMDKTESAYFRCPNKDCLQSFVLEIEDAYLFRNLEENRTELIPKDCVYIEERQEFDSVQRYSKYVYNCLLSCDKVGPNYQESVKYQTDTDLIGRCVICKNKESVSEWFKAWEYSALYSSNEILCPLCGSEVVSKTIQNHDENMNLTEPTTVFACEECSFNVPATKKNFKSLMK